MTSEISAPSIAHAFQFCPRCGVLNPNQGQAPFRCAPCGFSFFFGPVAAVGALIVNDDAQLLLVRRARDPGKGLWGLPGGFVDAGEALESAMRREVFEETQLEVVEERYLYSASNQYQYGGFTAPVLDVFFVCRVLDPQNLVLEASELSEAQWCSPSPVHLDNMAFPSNRQAIEYWMNSDKTLTPARNPKATNKGN